MKKYVAELVGTFTLVFFGCATIIFMVDEVGLLGVGLAFGLSVTAMAYSIGQVSGAHINPAVSLGFLVSGRMGGRDFVGYVVAQVGGAILAALALAIIVTGGPEGGAGVAAAANGWSAYAWGSAFLFEVIATAIFILVILGATQEGAPASMAGLVIGLTLALIHFAGITVSGSSVNPARSIGPALVGGGAALGQLWLYIVAPLIGGAIGGALWKAGVTAK